jgi:hypothetical protein
VTWQEGATVVVVCDAWLKDDDSNAVIVFFVSDWGWG